MQLSKMCPWYNWLSELKTIIGWNMQSLTYSSSRFCHINFNKNSISERFWVNVSSVFYGLIQLFEIIYGFWLTDPSYTHLLIIDESGNIPEFSGPDMVHFRKDFMDYKRLATEMTFANENIYKIKQAGSDMDPAIFNGIGPVFSSTNKWVCMQQGWL